jgi:protoporphyrinogen oxidase
MSDDLATSDCEAHAAVAVIGAGPAGLTAAFELTKMNIKVTVLEADRVIGGIARTVNYKGFLFDIGGHRFYTKVALVSRIWREVLGDEFLRRPRLSRIFFRGKFFRYPLDPWDTVAKLGPVEAARCLASWAAAVIRPTLPERDLQTWVTNRFGRRLFLMFFKTYTEKVWGMRCDEIASDWAAQRIRGLSFRSLISSTLGLRGKRGKGGEIKTLIEQFDYPRRGPGAMWDGMAALVAERGGQIILDAAVDRIEWEPGAVVAVHAGGRRYQADNFISSMPIAHLIERLSPPAPDWLANAAQHFRYRDFLTVALIVDHPNLFPDNWIYIHEPMVKVGRIQNFKNWSPDMVPDPNTTCLGLEYFCFEGDDLWNASDAELIELARKEVEALGLAEAAAIIDGAVVRMPKAYPVYNDTYKQGLSRVRDFLEMVPNLQLVGRNGMHHYNNQDHSMLTAVLAARNIAGADYDLWGVNVDADYLEEGSAIDERELDALRATQPAVPARVTPA